MSTVRRRPLPPVARLLAFICRAVLSSVARVRVEGAIDLPQTGPLILMPNHASNADPPLVGGWVAPALGRRPIFLAKEQLFVGLVGAFLRWQGVVPVRAGGSDAEAYRVCRRLLEAGEVIVISPEGTRSHDGTLGEPKPGVALLATRLGVPVLPIGISGSGRFLGRGAQFPRFGTRITIRVGRPIKLELDPSLPRRQALDVASQELMRHLAGLVDERHRGRYEPMPLEPPPSDVSPI
jgi:1-acyl-sn-glycerol-3-phosphate acyltransferase